MLRRGIKATKVEQTTGRVMICEGRNSKESTCTNDSNDDLNKESHKYGR